MAGADPISNDKRAAVPIGTRLILALCIAPGLLMIVAAILGVTPGHAVRWKQVLGVPEFPNHLLYQIVSWVRWFLCGFGLSLLVAGCLWRPMLRRALREDPLGRTARWKISVPLLAGTLPMYLLLERVAFQCFPLTPDEFAYLFQAKVLASGRLSVPAHPLQPFFTSAFIAFANGRLFSIMPPGWSFFLVPWVWAGVAWMASPVLSSLSVLLVFWIGEAIYTRTVACVAAVLMAISPFFVFMGGTYFAHPLSLFLILVAALLVVRILEKEEKSWPVYLLLGFVLCLVPVVHHFDTFLLSPMLVLLGFRFLQGPSPVRKRIALAAGVSVAGLTAFTTWYNLSVTGSALKVPHEIYVNNENYLGEIPRYASMVGIASLGQLKARVFRLVTQLLQLNLVMFPLAPVLFLVPVFSRRRSRWDVVLTSAVGSMLVAYLFYWCRGGFQFGPRYYYPAVGFFYLLILRSLCMPFRSARQQEGEGARGGWVQAFAFLGFLWVVGFQVGVSCGTARMVRDVVEYARIIEDVGGWFERRGIRNSVIFLTPSKEDKNTNAQKIFLRVRNEPDFSDTNLTASDRGPENGRLMAYYPGRRYFLYEIDIDRLVRGEEMNWREIYRREYPEPSSLGLGP